MKNLNKRLTTRDALAEVRGNKNFLIYSKDAEIRVRLAAEIYNVRKFQMHWNQEDLAKKIGSTQKVISKIENGEVNVGIELLGRLVASLMLTEDSLGKIFSCPVLLNFNSSTSASSSVVETNQKFSKAVLKPTSVATSILPNYL